MTDAEQIEIQTADGPMPAWKWLPRSGRGPGLLVIQEIFGLSAYVQERARQLAELGYVVVAPALFWRVGELTVDETRPDYLPRAMELASRLDDAQPIDDSRAALTALADLDEVDGGTGVVGFCFGGGVGFAVAALADPDVFVCYYGSSVAGQLDRADRVTPHALYHFGLADDYIPPDVVAAIAAAVPAGSDFRTYPGAGHAFDNPRPPFHHADASRAAWTTTVDFLARELPTT